MNVTNKSSQNEVFSSIFNFAITKICVGICSAEDGTRMDGQHVVATTIP